MTKKSMSQRLTEANDRKAKEFQDLQASIKKDSAMKQQSGAYAKKDVVGYTYRLLESDEIVALMREVIHMTDDGKEKIGSFIFVHGKYRFEYNANTQLYVLESRQFDQGKIQEDED